MLHKLKYTQEQREKKAFYCSDYGKAEIDLYFAFAGETPTNPPIWSDTLKWAAGKGVEMAMLDILKDNGITAREYIQEEHGRVEMVREGVQINGYIDAMTNGDLATNFDLEPDCPIEIKSINNKNTIDIAKYERGEPRENYVGQLACYMDFLGKDTGYLFVSSIDGLSTFIFECKRNGDVFTCGNTKVDINKEYKRWSDLYTGYVQKNTIPPVTCRYKIPVEEIKWESVSKNDISKARNNNKVIGDPDSWQIQYSPWKNKILELQGVVPGYSEEELKRINELTKGYTTWTS